MAASFYDGRMFVSDKTLHRKDFVLSARADGFEFASRVETLDELEEKLNAFVRFDGPAFLEVMIDPNADVFPMVGPGQSYAHMVTGPFIEPRAAREVPFDGTDSKRMTDMF